MSSWLSRGVAVLAALVVSFSVSSADAREQGRLVIDQEVVDVGDVVRGQEAQATFVLRNSGPGTLRILSAKPACGCTVASFDEKIEPGKQGKVTATLKTENFRGAIEKTVALASDDPTASTRELRIKANVVGSVVLLPRPGLALPSGLAWEFAGKLLVRKDPTEKGSLEIRDITTSVPWLAAKARRVEVAEPAADGLPAAIPGDFVLEMSVTDDAKGKASAGQSVKFKTGLPRESEVTIPVSVMLLNALRVIPSQLLLPLPSGAEKQSVGTVTALVRPGLGKDKLQATASPDAFAVKLEPDGPRRYRATVTWKPGTAETPKDGTVSFRIGEESFNLPVHVGDARALFEGAKDPSKKAAKGSE